MKENKESARTMLCEFCRGFFPISEIRYVPKGNSKISLCATCRERGLKEEGKKNKIKEKADEDVYYTEKKGKSSELSKDSYFCRRCKYKFKFAPVNDTNLKCPYCGRTDSVVEDNKLRL